MDYVPQGPWWLETVRIAERMGVSAQKLIGGSRTLWYARYQAIRNSEIHRGNRQRQRAIAAEQQAEQMAHHRGKR